MSLIQPQGSSMGFWDPSTWSKNSINQNGMRDAKLKMKWFKFKVTWSPIKLYIYIMYIYIYIFLDGFIFECCHFYHVVVYYIHPLDSPLHLQLSPSGDGFRFTKNRQNFPPTEQRWWSHNLTKGGFGIYACQCYTSEEKQKENVRNTKSIQKIGSSFGQEEFEFPSKTNETNTCHREKQKSPAQIFQQKFQ